MLMAKNKIAFYGQMGAGKTWAAKLLVADRGFYKVAFADKLKDIAYEMFNVQGKDGRDRVILQQLGTKLREIDPDVWLNFLLKKVKFLENKGVENIVLDDLRYVNEAKALRAAGFRLIIVTAPEELRLARIHALYPNTPPEAIMHASEQDWQRIEPDATLNSVDVNAVLELKELLNG